jgi:metal-responsive CopG/Arc/MetJ family transcriptional regulator
MPKTNPIPKGTQNVSVNLPEQLAKHLKQLAEQSGMSRNRYCATVLKNAAESDTVFRVRTEIRTKE